MKDELRGEDREISNIEQGMMKDEVRRGDGRKTMDDGR